MDDCLPPALHAQVALVSGASSGIGRAIAVRLARSGAQVCGLGRDRIRLQALQDELLSLGAADPVTYQLDLTEDAEVRALARWAAATLGRLDILVHSAGVIRHGTVSDAPVEMLDHQYRLNLRAPYLLTQALLPRLIQSQGQLLFVNSTAGLTGIAGAGAYCATKHGLRALADTLRRETARLGVRVTSIYPARTATPMQAAVHEVECRRYHPEFLVQPADIAEMIVHAVGLPRTAEVTDLCVRPRPHPVADPSPPPGDTECLKWT